jgi:hypothetical protein
MLFLQKIPFVKQIYQTDLEQKQLNYILNIYGRRPVKRSWRFCRFLLFPVDFRSSFSGLTRRIYGANQLRSTELMQVLSASDEGWGQGVTKRCRLS